MKILSAITVGLFFILLSVAEVFAGYKGPTSSDFVKGDVKTALEASDNTPMALEGHIISHIRKDKYYFQDDTGKIIVEIDKEDFYELEVDENTSVRLIGKIDKDFGKDIEFDVKEIEIIQ